jgi:ABC-type uncharacterized transport system substrate-binding protein
VRTYAAACRRKGLELVTRGYVTSSEAGEAAKALCAERLDAVLPLPDAQSMMTGPLLSQTAAAATLPLLALWPGADIRPSMYLKSPGNGMQTIMRRFAEMAVRVLEGTDPATMPFVNVANPVRRLTVVPEAAAAVGLSVPERLRATVS